MSQRRIGAILGYGGLMSVVVLAIANSLQLASHPVEVNLPTTAAWAVSWGVLYAGFFILAVVGIVVARLSRKA